MVQLEGYSLIRVLYEGGSSVVYRATRVSDKTPVIWKMLRMEYPSANDLSSFRREYEISARLGGAGTVRIHALEKVANSLAIVMEDVGAESLNRQPSLVNAGIGEKLTIACQVADALSRVHGQNIIHKDINPSNIIRNLKTGVVRIIDFGIATELTRENAPLPGMGAMEGTLAYISPEQTGRMIQPVDYRTDLYSLGVTLYELFTGRLPFTGNDMLELVYSHIARVPVAPRDINPEVPDPVAAIILKLMSKAPEDRYQSASGLQSDLERCQNEWNETGKIQAFPIGQSDGSDRFTIPNRLYGRQEELAILHHALDENAKEAPRLLLVGGAPGVGKSSLIHEIDRFLLGRNGFLACGKFNQLEKNVPYSALLLALRNLLDQLLCASAERIDACKDSIRSALGANAGLLVELLPKLGQVLGPQDPPVPLDPVAAQNRFQLAVRQFIEALAQDGHPIAIFLDDLQWADSPTLDLVHYLLRGNRIANLLIIGAYRDSEVGEEHPLSLLCRALGEKSQDDHPLHRTILVKPLAVQDVNQLVADTLHSDPATTLELASIVHNKTDGNPFFVNQMLITLHARGAFSYDASLRRWRWNLDQVAKAELGDNVVEFLVKKLASLSGEAREVVKIAACIGNQFDLQTLASVHGQGSAALGRGLWEAIAKEIVIPLDHNYRLLHLQEGSVDIATIEAVLRFQHDRILHAAYAMIPAEERPDIHHRIGREMLKTFRRAESDAYIFTLVNHLNLGKKHVSGPDARRELAELNVLVGRKAMLSTAFRTAAEYFGKGQSLLSDEEWACLPGPRFSLCFQRAESLFLAGELRQAEALVGPLLDLADGDVQKASVYRLRSKIREFQGDLLGAIDEVRKGLGPFGLSLPESKAEIGQKVGEDAAGLRTRAHRCAPRTGRNDG
jgi:histidine kinase